MPGVKPVIIPNKHPIKIEIISANTPIFLI